MPVKIYIKRLVFFVNSVYPVRDLLKDYYFLLS